MTGESAGARRSPASRRVGRQRGDKGNRGDAYVANVVQAVVSARYAQAAAALAGIARDALRRAQPKDWRQRAACAGMDPELRFPAKPEAACRQAVAVCAACPVARACLAYALLHGEEHGVWAGQTPSRLRTLRSLVVIATARDEIDRLLDTALPGPNRRAAS